MDTALIIGGTGFIGRPLVRRLQREGLRAVALGRSSPPILEIISRVKPSYVFMLAKIRDPKPAVQATINLAQALREGAPKLKALVRTGLRLSDQADAALHAAIRDKYKLPVVTLRLFRVYGPGQEPTDLIPTLVRGSTPDSSEGGFQDLVYIDDAVEAFLLAAKRPQAAGQIVPIGCGLVRTTGRIAAEIAKALKRKGPAEFDEEKGEGVAADTEPALRLLGWKPKVSLCEGAKRMWRARDGSAPAKPRNSRKPGRP